jgi:DNA sulfur modification protein DndC
MQEAADKEEYPLKVHLLHPDPKDSFWANLIGRGYPAPRNRFRWCTERMKIDPVTRFVEERLTETRQAIILLGTRYQESQVRGERMRSYEKDTIRDVLSPHQSQPNTFVYPPIRDWSNDEVWLFLTQVPNPWGINNKDLLNMYRGATEDKECPLVMDKTTPSCGDSRFGCWVCTMVEQDKSMKAMVMNDDENEWLKPLLDYRNMLDFRGNEKLDHHLRDFRRRSGSIDIFERDGEALNIHGPYLQSVRENYLRKLLQTQKLVRTNPKTPEQLHNIELIRVEELNEIRRIWVEEKHEIEDSLPRIYKEEMGEEIELEPLKFNQPFSHAEMNILKDIAGENELHFELCRELISIEQSYKNELRRHQLFQEMEKSFKRNFFDSKEEALDHAKEIFHKKQEYKKKMEEQNYDSVNEEVEATK